eukprot:gnl/MRDRNA2_/MRDRNA2_128846_c0_seq1.p1 gnl/MRDRNA2_/MRDRNA2_128846_c0~~gnl/MRDRNA2_/MRDRNA2_128846_c0_seq1.p1  ORF type:complete len:359 (+),score=28.24 gnl/MRDRNA2_/MRDRNA2_128846_c0_seq1:48-1079(+)
MLPLSLFSRRKYLSFTPVLSMLVNVYLLILVFGIAYLGRTKQHFVCLMGYSTGAVTCFSALIQAVVIQQCVLPIYKELDNRTPKHFMTALGFAFLFVFIVFTAFAGFAYATYGANVHSNILRDLPQNVWGHSARMGMLVSICGVYPSTVKSMVASLKGGPRTMAKNKRRIHLATLFIVLGSMTIAFFLMDLGLVNVILGSLQCFGFVGLAPAALDLYLMPHTRRQLLVETTSGKLVAKVEKAHPPSTPKSPFGSFKGQKGGFKMEVPIPDTKMVVQALTKWFPRSKTSWVLHALYIACIGASLVNVFWCIDDEGSLTKRCWLFCKLPNLHLIVTKNSTAWMKR